MSNKKLLNEKLNEALTSVLPITVIVLLLCFTIAPIPNNMLVSFLTGAVMLIVGMAFFTVGADTAMTPIGNKVGSCITKSKSMWVIVFVSFLLGVIITVSEPDLQVLAKQVPGIPNAVLVGAVAVGVGIFQGDCNGILDPTGNATRAQIAKIMMNYCVMVLGK